MQSDPNPRRVDAASGSGTSERCVTTRSCPAGGAARGPHRAHDRHDNPRRATAGAGRDRRATRRHERRSASGELGSETCLRPLRKGERGSCTMALTPPRISRLVFALALLIVALAMAAATTVVNPLPLCQDNTALFNPDNGQDIVLPAGVKVSVFK